MVPRTDVADRLSVSLTLVLTAAAYKFVVASMLPQISYFTMLDHYVLMCSGFLFLVVIENGVMSTNTWAGNTLNSTAMDNMDETVVQTLLALFLATNVWFVVMSCRVTRRNALN